MRVDASQVLAQGGVRIKSSEDSVKQGSDAAGRRGGETAAAKGADARSAESLAKQAAETAVKQGQEVLTKQGAEALAKQGTEVLIETLKEGVLVGGEEEAEEASKNSDAKEKDAAGEKGAARERGDAGDKAVSREKGAAGRESEVRERGAAPGRTDARGRDAAREGGAVRERGETRESGAARERGDVRESGAAGERGAAGEKTVSREQGAAGADSAARGKGDVVAESAVGGRRTVVAEGDITLAKPDATREFSDKSLEPYAAKLVELKMPVSEDTARAMRDLMAQYPKLSMDEAAFLATNKLIGDESLMRAALSVLSGGDKTSAMIAQIISTLEGGASGGQNSLVDMGAGARDPKNVFGNSNLSNNFHVGGSNHAPLTELIAAAVKNASGLLVSAGNAQSEVLQGNPASGNNPQQIITQLDSNMQLNEEKIINFLQEDPGGEQKAGQGSMQSGGASGAQTAPGATAGAMPGSAGATGMPGLPGQEGAAAGTGNSLAGAGSAAGSAVGGAFGTAQAAADGVPAGAGQTAEQTASHGAAAEQAGAQNAEGSAARGDTRSAPGAMAQLLSELPEFKGTPQAALDRFSNMLLRIAEDAGVTKGGGAAADEVKLLASQFEKLFTKIGRQDADAGARLREAREELFARLTLVQEEIARASQPVRAELLSQTQRLMDHVRLLNNIDQFVYMQLPVKLSDEERTAELYVFKRKGGKRADPDNVNILLSIDLQFMGHWEALLNIKGKNVYLNMEVAGEAEKEHFSRNTVLLHNLLAEEGFKLMNTSIKISQEETTPLTAMSALDRYTGAAHGKIDFVI